MDREKADAYFKEHTKHEVEFLEGEGSGTMNENGAYIYVSQDGNHSLRLDLYLRHYRDWLIENDIVKEII